MFGRVTRDETVLSFNVAKFTVNNVVCKGLKLTPIVELRLLVDAKLCEKICAVEVAFIRIIFLAAEEVVLNFSALDTKSFSDFGILIVEETASSFDAFDTKSLSNFGSFIVTLVVIFM